MKGLNNGRKPLQNPRSILRPTRSRYHYHDPDSGGDGGGDVRGGVPGGFPTTTAAEQGLISSVVPAHDVSDMRATYTSTPAPHHKTSSPGDHSLTGSSDPFRARGLIGGSSTRSMNQQYSASSLNYLQADRDLSAVRAEQSLSPEGHRDHHQPPDHMTSPPPYTPQHSGYHGNTFTGPSTYVPERDYSGSSHAATLSANQRRQHFYDSRQNVSSQDTTELNKSSSVFYSGDRRDPNQPFYTGYHHQHHQPVAAVTTDTPRIARVRDNYLRQRMSDDDVNGGAHKRSHSVGDPLNSAGGGGGGVDFSGRTSPRFRTPSAPANLNHSTSPPSQPYHNARDTPVSERVLAPSGTNHSLLSATTHSGGGFEREPVLSRSIMSGEYRVRDTTTNRSMLSSVSLRLPHDVSRTSRDVSTTLNYSQSMPAASAARDGTRDSKRLASTPNGTAKPVGDHVNGASKHSLDLSKTSSNQLALLGRNYGVVSSLVSLIFIATIALVLAFLAVQLLFRLNSRTATGLVDSSTVLSDNSYDSTRDVTVALTTFVLMLDTCCLLVTSMQFFFAVKLVKCPQGDERCYKYLKECAPTRFIAVAGFFLSIPVLMLSMLLYMLMEYNSTSAIISAVILTVGLTFIITAVVHSTYIWRVEKSKADLNLPPYDKRSPCSQSELSTLV